MQNSFEDKKIKEAWETIEMLIKTKDFHEYLRYVIALELIRQDYI